MPVVRLPSNITRVALDDQVVPAAGDPWWAKLTIELLVFLKEKDRDWKELEAWAKREKKPLDIVRHMMAWLSINKKAYWHGDRWSTRPNPRPKNKPDSGSAVPRALLDDDSVGDLDVLEDIPEQKRVDKRKGRETRPARPDGLASRPGKKSTRRKEIPPRRPASKRVQPHRQRTAKASKRR